MKNDSLKGVPIEDLERELALRKETEAKARQPKPLASPDFAPLIKLCEGYIEGLADGGKGVDEDYDHWVFECAMECVFGKSVWNWTNKRLG